MIYNTQSLIDTLGEIVMTQKKEHTLAMIKPDAVGSNDIGGIIEYWERDGLRIAGALMIQLTEKDAKAFYEVHKERGFYNELVTLMTSGPVLAVVLEGENAVEANRKLMGATDPKKAEDGTIRADFASGIERNAVHGSDSKENAKIEIAFFVERGLKVCERK
jgi:nucleoside-diphosphate kinase